MNRLLTVYVNSFDIPSNLKSKTALLKHGFDISDFGPVVAEGEFEGKRYPLYNWDTVIANALKSGHKAMITERNKSSWLIMDVNVTDWEATDEVIELMLMNFDGEVLFHKWFKPSVAISEKNLNFLGRHAKRINSAKNISEYWDEIQSLIAGKTLIVPNKFNVWSLIAQTCKKNKLSLTVSASIVEGRKRIQNDFVSKVVLDEKASVLLQTNCINLIRCLYPESALFATQERAKYYFNLFCNYNVRNGDRDNFSKGYSWIFRDFKEKTKDFEDYNLNTCKGIINGLEGPLRSFNMIF